jgi:hypothetical protein
MSQTGRDKPIVFVSHVEEDAAIASEIKAWIEDNLLKGADVFVSGGDIDPGDKWEERVEEKLKNCCIALIVCTQMSIRQPWINFETGGALVKGAKVIPLCYHGQRKGTLPRPLSSLHALDLSEPDDVRKLLETIATEAGLHAPDIDPNVLIERLPSRNDEGLAVDGELPDVRVKVNSVMVPNYQNGTTMCFLELKAENHDKNSVFLDLPIIATRDDRKKFSILYDSAHHLPVPIGELKPGDSRCICVDPTTIEIEDMEQLGEAIFRDKIGREFKGSAEATLIAVQRWKAENEVCSEYHYKNTSKP